jgi:tetratricopeptide (TPR) repeat protein
MRFSHVRYPICGACLISLLVLGLTASAHEIIDRKGSPTSGGALPFQPSSGTWQAATIDEATAAGVRRIQAEANAATARRDFDAADALHREALALAPELALAPYARFVRLTSRETAAGELSQLIESNRDAWSVVTRARGLAELGQRQAALEILLADPAATEGRDAAATLLAAHLLRAEGRLEDRVNFLASALASAPDAAQAEPIFHALASGDLAGFEKQPDRLMAAMQVGLEAMRPPRMVAIELIDPILILIQREGEYLDRRQAYFEAARAAGPAAQWVATRMMMREERHERALEYLEPLAEAARTARVWPLVAEELAVLKRTVGRHGESWSLMQAARAAQKGAEAARLGVEAAGAALANGEVELAFRILQETDLSEATVATSDRSWMLQIVACCRMGDLDLLIATYANIAKDAHDEDFEFFNQLIFQSFQETDQHIAIEQKVRERFAADSETAPNLWRLAAAAAVESRRRPNQIEALYQCAIAQPGKLSIMADLANEVAPLVVELAQASPEMLAIPQEEVDKLRTIAEGALLSLCRALPYDPQWYAHLIKVREAFEDREGAARVPAEIIGDTRDIRLLDNAGFVLATNGYPEAALPFYQRALEIRPDQGKIRINYAAALTRLDRFDEAEAIYKDILLNGFHGKVPWHAHELIERLWFLAEHRGTEQETIEWFRELTGQRTGTWREELLENFGNLMANMGRPDEARDFYMLRYEETNDPAVRRNMLYNLAFAWLSNKNYPEALAAFQRGIEQHGSEDEQYAIDMAYGLARAQHGSGDIESAIATLRDIATRYHAHQEALTALHLAGRLAEQTGRLEEARALYMDFLKTNSTDFARRNEVEARFGTP